MTDRKDILARIAAAQAHRSPVDANGRHTTKPSTFTYDADGKLVSATSDPTPAEPRQTAKSALPIPDRSQSLGKLPVLRSGQYVPPDSAA